MQSLALPLSLAFSVWLLVRDSRRRPSVSPAVWIPIVTLLVLASKPLSAWFGIEGSRTETLDNIDGSPVDRIFYLVMIALSWIVALRRGVKWDKFLKVNLALALFYLYFGLSFLWSDNPLGSFKRWFKDAGYVCILVVLISEKDPVEAVRASYIRSAYILLPLSVVLVKYYPSISRTYSNTGEMLVAGPTTQKNSLGQMVMLFILFLAWDYLESRSTATKRLWSRIPWVTALLVAMGAWLLYVSDSKTALVCTIIGLALVMRKGRLATSPVINGLILCVALSLPFVVLLSRQFGAVIAPMVNELGRDLTFTGRTEIWQKVMACPVNPLFGAGFYNFWGQQGGVEIRRSMGEPGLVSSHNGFLEIYLDGGYIGLTLLVCMLLGCAFRLIRRLHEGRYEQLRFAVLVLAIVYNLTEAMFARPTLIWFTTLLVLINAPGLRAKIEPARATARDGAAQ